MGVDTVFMAMTGLKAQLITVVHKMSGRSLYSTYLLSKPSYFFLLTVSSVSTFLSNFFCNLCGCRTDVLQGGVSHVFNGPAQGNMTLLLTQLSLIIVGKNWKNYLKKFKHQEKNVKGTRFTLLAIVWFGEFWFAHGIWWLTIRNLPTSSCL